MSERQEQAIGPQRGPASPAQVEAQARQARRRAHISSLPDEPEVMTGCMNATQEECDREAAAEPQPREKLTSDDERGWYLADSRDGKQCNVPMHFDGDGLADREKIEGQVTLYIDDAWTNFRHLVHAPDLTRQLADAHASIKNLAHNCTIAGLDKIHRQRDAAQAEALDLKELLAERDKEIERLRQVESAGAPKPSDSSRKKAIAYDSNCRLCRVSMRIAESGVTRLCRPHLVSQLADAQRQLEAIKADVATLIGGDKTQPWHELEQALDVHIGNLHSRLEAANERASKADAERDAAQAANAELGQRLVQEIESAKMQQRLKEAHDKMIRGVWADHERQFAAEKSAREQAEAKLAEAEKELTKLRSAPQVVRGPAKLPDGQWFVGATPGRLVASHGTFFIENGLIALRLPESEGG